MENTVQRLTIRIFSIGALLVLSTTTVLSQQLPSLPSTSTAEVGTTAGGCSLVFLFGAFCALWAQNQGRNAFLWFFLGLFLNVIAVFLVLILNDTSPNAIETRPPRPLEQTDQHP
jgi:hypothetical protein